MKFTLLIISICCLYRNTTAQINRDFLMHLYNNNLDYEIVHYLNKTVKNTDTLNFELLKHSVSFNKDSTLNLLTRKHNLDLLISDSDIVKKISLRLLKDNDKKLKYWWYDSLLNNNTITKSQMEIKNVWKTGENPLKNGESLMLNEYSNSYYQFKKYYSKKPIVAAALSAVIPGLGKAYIHKPISFLGNFFSNVLVGAQTFESITKFGIKNAFSVFNLSVASIFYLSNVFGSYNDCKMAIKMKKINYLNEANNFYNDLYNFNTYQK